MLKCKVFQIPGWSVCQRENVTVAARRRLVPCLVGGRWRIWIVMVRSRSSETTQLPSWLFWTHKKYCIPGCVKTDQFNRSSAVYAAIGISWICD